MYFERLSSTDFGLITKKNQFACVCSLPYKRWGEEIQRKKNNGYYITLHSTCNGPHVTPRIRWDPFTGISDVYTEWGAFGIRRF